MFIPTGLRFSCATIPFYFMCLTALYIGIVKGGVVV
jgi:hypothetical protein